MIEGRATLEGAHLSACLERLGHNRVREFHGVVSFVGVEESERLLELFVVVESFHLSLQLEVGSRDWWLIRSCGEGSDSSRKGLSDDDHHHHSVCSRP